LCNLAASTTLIPMLLIYSPAITNRLRYIMNLLFRELLGLEFKFTISPDEYARFEGPKISYSRDPLADGVFIEACGLLSEEMIIPYDLKPGKAGAVPVLFSIDNPKGQLAFDPFAAAFYMVSRYEEYLPHSKDKQGRYPASESIAFKGKFLDVPVVHLWAGMVADFMLKHYPALKIIHPEYNYVPTIDVDHAYCYLGRTFIRMLGGITREAIHGRLNDLGLRRKVLLGLAADPYDNYSFICKVHEMYQQSPLYFILFADYGGDDNNISVTSELFKRLILELDQMHGVGIHPSLSSNRIEMRLQAEVKSLGQVLQREVTISRQHFLYLNMPQTYRSLVQLGIGDDYSMGYPSHPGFRAGIAIPFQFFDLISNETIPLIVHPVSMMDVTLKDYLRLSTEESLDAINHMVGTIKSVHGQFVSIWHNESLSDTGRWKGWRRVYEEMVKSAST